MQSGIIFLIVLFLLIFGDSVSKTKVRWPKKNNWLAPILNETKRLVKPRQVHIYLQGNYKLDREEKNYLIGSLMKEFPILIVNIAAFKGPRLQVYLHRQKDQYPISSMLNVFIMSWTDNQVKEPKKQINRMLDQVRDRRIADRLPRAKCLLIIFLPNCHRNTKKIEERVYESLTAAWSKNKFLDLSYVLICRNLKTKRPDFFYHHPFIKKNVMLPLNSRNRLFPDKLKRLNGTKFMLGVKDEQWQDKRNYRRESLEALTPADYIFVKDFFARSMNLQVQIKPSDQSLCKNCDMFSDIVVWGENYRVNALTQPLTWEMVSAALPNIEKTQTALTTASRYDLTPTFVFLLVILFIWSIFVTIAKIFRFEWNYFGVLLCILGYRLVIQSTRLEKVVFLTMSLLSIILSNELLSLITQLALTEEVEPVDDYGDLAKFNTTLYSHHDGYLIFSTAPRSLRLILKDRTVLMDERDMDECLSGLVLQNNRICVADVSIIDNFQSRYAKKIRVSDFHLMTDFDSVIFTESSPYLEKFNEIALRAFDMGHVRLDVLKVRNGGNHMEYSTEQMKVEEGVLVIMTWVIMVPGLGFAILVFLMELVKMWWTRIGKEKICTYLVTLKRKFTPKQNRKGVRFSNKVDVVRTPDLEVGEDELVENSEETT